MDDNLVQCSIEMPEIPLTLQMKVGTIIDTALGDQVWTGQRGSLSAPNQESVTEERMSALALWNRQNFASFGEVSTVTMGKEST